jgi:hypothetical protein
LVFVLVLLFIGPSASECTSFSQALKAGIYNYITCLDTSLNYLVENVSIINKIAKIPYKNAYDKVMTDRHLVKHFIESGQTLDDIIKFYNNDIENIEDFRKVVYKENPDIVSRDYNLKSGEFILIPSE